MSKDKNIWHLHNEADSHWIIDDSLDMDHKIREMVTQFDKILDSFHNDINFLYWKGIWHLLWLMR